MNKKTYTIKDTSKMSWEEFGNVMDILLKKLSEYQKQQKIKFDIITPILRSGMIPATVIANKFWITKILPIQIKCIYTENGIVLKQLLAIPEMLQETPKSPNILICENNTMTGNSAKKAISLIKEKYPTANIFYATVAKVYGGPISFNDVEEYFWGIRTNEMFKVSSDEEKKLELRSKITIFPWESADDELAAINS